MLYIHVHTLHAYVRARWLFFPDSQKLDRIKMSDIVSCSICKVPGVSDKD